MRDWRSFGGDRARGRCCGDGRTRLSSGRSADGWPGNDRTRGRLGSDSGALRWCSSNGSSRSWLRNNPARHGLRSNWGSGSRNNRDRGLWRRRRGHRGGLNRRRGGGSWCGPWRRSGCGCFLLLLLQDGFQHISGLRDVGQIDLGPGRGVSARGAGCTGLTALEVGAHTLGLVILQRTGVCLLLSDAYCFKNIKNGFALDFQFTC